MLILERQGQEKLGQPPPHVLGLKACFTTWLTSNRKFNTHTILLIIIYMIWLSEGVCLPQCMCRGQRTAFWSWFSPSTLLVSVVYFGLACPWASRLSLPLSLVLGVLGSQLPTNISSFVLFIIYFKKIMGSWDWTQIVRFVQYLTGQVPYIAI